MGNYITFEQPNTETSWNYAVFERSLLQSASYTQIEVLPITNNTYYDETGTSLYWYRLRFLDGGSGIYSDYCDPFKANNEYYITPREVASFMGRDPFTDSTNPTRFVVEDIIGDACDEIDKRTHSAWRKRRIINEYHDVRIQDRYQGYGAYPYDYSTRISLMLKNKPVRPFVSGDTKIEVWDGNSWVDFITTYTEDRKQDYWINYERGIIYFVNRYPLRQRSNVRVTYDYGEANPPHDISMCALFLTAAEIVGGKEDLNIVYPQSTMGTVLDTKTRYEKWNESADKIIERYRQMVSTRYY